MAEAVTVVIVTYRSAGTIEACVRSVRDQCTQLVVVDNASDDESVAVLRRLEVDAVERATNGGLGTAANEGLRRATGDWVLFLNPDTVCPEGAIDALVRAAEERRGAGLVSPVLENADGSVQAIVEREMTPARLVRGLLRLGGAVRPVAPRASGPPVEVEWVHGAAVLMRTAFARQLGGWDERFFLYAEDADLCARVRAAGRTVIVVPEVHVRHVGGASFALSMSPDDQAALRVAAVGRYLDVHHGRWARRLYMSLATAVYGVGGHRAQARAARAAVR